MKNAEAISKNGLIKFNKKFDFNKNDINTLNQIVGLDGKNYKIDYDTTYYIDNINKIRYQQYYMGIPIYGAYIDFIEDEGKPLIAKGKILNSTKMLANTPSISKDEAFNIAVNSFKEHLFIWQIDSIEQKLKETTGNIEATYKPQGELYFSSVTKTPIWDINNYALHYVFKMRSINPDDTYEIFINSINGKITKKKSLLVNHNVSNNENRKNNIKKNKTLNINAPLSTTTASGVPLYNGGVSETFITNYRAISFNYELKDKTIRNIETRKYYTFNFNSADRFLESGTNWTWSSNEIGWSSHWAAKVTWEYFKQNHGRNGMDGNSTYLNKLMATSNILTGGARFRSDLSASERRIEVGSYIDGTVLHSLGVIAHEWAHAINFYSGGYPGFTNEQYAITEGLADIFSIAARRFDSGSVIWTSGDEFTGIPTTEPVHRHHSNPNLYSQSDHVGDAFWDPNSVDRNEQSVLTHWFYRLVVGGTHPDTNVSGSGIGFYKAINLFYRAVTLYVGPGEDFEDIRESTIQASNDLYGGCSNESIQVVNAWDAVNVNGVGCNLGAPLSVSVNGKNNLFINEQGSYSTSVSGGTLPFTYDWTITTNSGVSDPGNVSSFNKTMTLSDEYFDIDLTVTDLNGNTGSDSFYVYCNDCDGGFSKYYSIESSPNPAKNQIKVTLLAERNTPTSISEKVRNSDKFAIIRNVRGNISHTTDTFNDLSSIINTSYLPSGNYILLYFIGENYLSKHIIIVK